MAAYVDFSFYSGTYLGATIPAADFPRLALRASAVINQLCFGRAATVMASTDPLDAEKKNSIQLATCAVAEQLFLLSKNESGGEVASESVGSHSVSYVQNSTSKMSDDEKMAREARFYLWETGLMYRGFDEN